jgi:ketosteroid isomerase-like protein
MWSIAYRFNDRINARDLAGLAALMSDDHTFIDAAGASVVGRDACVEVWRGFFEAFPDYRNDFASAQVVGDVVTVVGRSVCSVPELDGPALWTCVVRGDQVAQWRVYEDTPATRAALNLPTDTA